MLFNESILALWLGRHVLRQDTSAGSGASCLRGAMVNSLEARDLLSILGTKTPLWRDFGCPTTRCEHFNSFERRKKGMLTFFAAVRIDPPGSAKKKAAAVFHLDHFKPCPKSEMMIKTLIW